MIYTLSKMNESKMTYIDKSKFIRKLFFINLLIYNCFKIKIKNE